MLPDTYFKASDLIYQGKKVPEELELEIAASYACYAFSYALTTGNKFKLGEKVISCDNYYSYAYSNQILKNRFLMGEKMLKNSYAYTYVKILKNRFIRKEKLILNGDYKFNYINKFKNKLAYPSLKISTMKFFVESLSPTRKNI